MNLDNLAGQFRNRYGRTIGDIIRKDSTFQKLSSQDQEYILNRLRSQGIRENLRGLMMNDVIKINESIDLRCNDKKTLIFENGDKIKILKESYEWDDIVEAIQSESGSNKFKNLIKYINKNRNKYRDDIQEFMKWAEDIDFEIEEMDKIVNKNKPQDFFESLPSNEWEDFK